jgi:hypothetical protein
VRLFALLGAAALVFALLGCSGSVSAGGGSVSKSEVEKQAQTQFDALAKSKGQASFPPITCPGDLDAKVGATEHCSATFSDGTLGITVKVASVSGDTAHMDFQADSAVTPPSS